MAKKESEGGKARERPATDVGDRDGVADGDDAAFALPIGRGFSRAKAPVAADEGAIPAGEDIGAVTWTPPFYLRYRLATAAGVVLSAAWLGASAYFIDRQILWPDLMVCQRRSKSTPLAGVKMHHLMRFSPALAVVPVVP